MSLTNIPIIRAGKAAFWFIAFWSIGLNILGNDKSINSTCGNKVRNIEVLEILNSNIPGIKTTNEFTDEFDIHNSWNFENTSLGLYTEAQMIEDFHPQNMVWVAPVDIVMDTINGIATKVMRMTNWANDLWHGFGMNIPLGKDYDEVYVSYNWKFSNEFNSTSGGKLPGFIGLPLDPEMGPNLPRSGYGFRADNMHKQAGSIISYHYDRTINDMPIVPWSTEDYKFNSIYFSNGTWYNITQRLVMNTFTNGKPNSDGIKELWVDGRLIFQETNLILMEDESSTMKIDGFRLAHYFGGDYDNYKPLTECYGYIDNIKVYTPVNDPVSGHSLHSGSAVLLTPDEITDRRVYFDKIITKTGTLSNSEYGSTYSSCIDETYLIDAGEGNTVNYTLNNITLGGADFLFFYDGNTTDAGLLKMYQGYVSETNQVISSTGRYLFVRFSTNTGLNSEGWTGTIAFSNSPVIIPEKLVPAPPSLLESKDYTENSITIRWNDNSTNESGFIIKRTAALNAGDVVSIPVSANDTSYKDKELIPSTTYIYSVNATNEVGDSPPSNRSIASTLSVAESKRSKNGLIAYYNFNYDPEYWVRDLSEYKEPLNLYVLQPSSVTWDKSSCLNIESGTAIVSAVPTKKIIDAVKLSQEISLECWIKPIEPGYTNTSRVISIGNDDTDIGIALSQDYTTNKDNTPSLNYNIRMQTGSTSESGFPELSLKHNISYLNMQHLVYIRDSTGKEIFYVNGVKEAEGFRPGDFNGWSDTYSLRFGNDNNLTQPWKGSFYTVAIFNKALSYNEVLRNYSVGPCDSLKSDGINYLLNIYPNPIKDQATVEIIPQETEDFVQQTSIRIVDLYGKTYFEDLIFNPNKQYSKTIDFKNYQSGIYLLEVISGIHRKAMKFIIQD